MNKNIPLYKIYWDEEDIEAISKIIRNGMYWTGGEEIKKFEKVIASYVDKRYALALNSGTSALHATLLAHDLRKDDEVIVPSFSFISTACSPLFVGAKPVFADIEEETLGLDPEDVQNKITGKTKAIIAIDYGGLPCKIRELSEIAEDNNLILIEDSAESLGAHINGEKVGSFGTTSIFSFTGNKIITTGEGGMVVTDLPEIYNKLKLICSHGQSDSIVDYSKRDYITLGYNWRISTITAALGLSQFKKINEVIDMRRKNAKYLTDRIKKFEKILPPLIPPGYHHVFQMYTIRVKGSRDSLKNYLTEKGISNKIYFQPVHLSYFFRNKFRYKGGEYPVTEKISKEVLTLPMYPTMTIEEMNYILNTIETYFKG